MRPYVITKGRWYPSRNTLRPETLLVAADPARKLPPTANQEERDLLVMCQGTLSLVEAAAHLELTFGVVVVLASALIDSGHLTVRSAGLPAASSQPSRELLERVLNGLRKL